MKNFVKKLQAKAAEKKGSLSVELILLIVVFTFVVVLALSGFANKMKTTIETTGSNIDAQTRCVAAGGEWFPNADADSTKYQILTGQDATRCFVKK